MSSPITTDGQQLPPEIEPLVLAVLKKRVADRDALARIPLDALYPEGRKENVRSPLDGAKLGSVSKTDPDPAWQIVDRRALTAHLEQDPANVEHVDDIVGTHEQVLEVLLEHAPQLLARVERVRDEAIAAALSGAQAEADKQANAITEELALLIREELAATGGKLPAAGPSAKARELGTRREAVRLSPIPGIKLVKPAGQLRVTADKNAGAAVERMVEAGIISWDGTPKALPATPEPPQRAIDPDCPVCGMPTDDDEDAVVQGDQQLHYGCAIARAEAHA